jgi:hypothetical protein
MPRQQALWQTSALAVIPSKPATAMALSSCVDRVLQTMGTFASSHVQDGKQVPQMTGQVVLQAFLDTSDSQPQQQSHCACNKMAACTVLVGSNS